MQGQNGKSKMLQAGKDIHDGKSQATFNYTRYTHTHTEIYIQALQESEQNRNRIAFIQIPPLALYINTQRNLSAGDPSAHPCSYILCHAAGLICLASLLSGTDRLFPWQSKDKHPLFQKTSIMEEFFFSKRCVFCLSVNNLSLKYGNDSSLTCT